MAIWSGVRREATWVLVHDRMTWTCRLCGHQGVRGEMKHRCAVYCFLSGRCCSLDSCDEALLSRRLCGRDSRGWAHVGSSYQLVQFHQQGPALVF
jgi:hypothetical protein